MSRLHSTVKKVVPRSAREGVRGAYWSSREWLERRPQEIALERLVSQNGDVVQSGPFAGMHSLTTMDDGCILPKLLGCYEEEIHHWIEAVVESAPGRVIDVGCASGWYTTGFAYRLPDADVLGFDVESDALARATELAELNGLGDRISLRNVRLDPSTLADVILEGDTFVMMDIDGPEIEVLDPSVDERLLGADILVEFHDHFNPAISGTIVERFASTHTIQRIKAQGRDPAHYRELDQFRSSWVREAAVAERRPTHPRQEFALMLKK